MRVLSGLGCLSIAGVMLTELRALNPDYGEYLSAAHIGAENICNPARCVHNVAQSSTYNLGSAIRH